jgi:WhiB family redox-sensing transcriptional regulator
MNRVPTGVVPYARKDSTAEELDARKLAMTRLLARYDRMRREPWRSFAACSEAKADVFFPDPTDQAGKVANVKEARAICAPCPVKLECLAFALAGRDRGIWAGTTEEQREAARAIPEDRRIGWLLNAVRTATGQYAGALIEWRVPAGLAERAS